MKEDRGVNLISLSLKAIDLFAGCGGLSLGFANAGFQIVAAYDNWQPAIKVYQKNFKHPIFNYDLKNITNFSTFQELAANVILGGPTSWRLYGSFTGVTSLNYGGKKLHSNISL